MGSMVSWRMRVANGVILSSLVAGLALGYDWYAIEPWLTSLRRTGYSGSVGIFLDPASPAFYPTEEKLANRGVLVFEATPVPAGWQTEPHVNKHRMLAEVLEVINYDRAVLTDLRDLVFQTNPVQWLDRYLKREIVVSSENIRYKDEPWNYQNIGLTFGDVVRQRMAEEEVFNSGILAGEAKPLAEFCRAIFQRCRTSAHGVPDQATLNVLLREDLWKGRVQRASMRSGFCLNAGPGTLKYWSGVERPIIRDGLVQMLGDEPFCMVHQYDTLFPMLRGIYRE